MIDDILELSRKLGASKEEFGLWGKTAAKRYVEDGISLNDSVTKIASEHSLNADEIARVCEQANLETYSKLLKQASPSDKSFEFPVADKSEIAASSNTKTAAPTVFFTDYERVLDEDLRKTAGLDIFEAFGVPQMEKVAQDNSRGEALIQKLERLAELERDKISSCLESSMETAEKFLEHVKQEVAGGKSFDEVEKALRIKADMADKPYADRLRELIAFAKNRMYDMGLLQHPDHTVGGGEDPTIKKAEPVEQSLISDTFESPDVTVSVINGRHPLFASIDTLVRQFEEADKSRYNLVILEDKIRYTKSRVRGKTQPL